MQTGQPSRTALAAAAHRAAHQLLEQGRIFSDPLAVRILGPSAAELIEAGQEDRARGAMRIFIAARTRFAEDSLNAAVQNGAIQLVVLGAGLDTYAYRTNLAGLLIFEVDHPATQAWKRDRLREVDIAIPPALTFAPVDFESQSLAEGLSTAGFDPKQQTFFTWLGVVPYLTDDAVWSTLRFIASLLNGAHVVFDYANPPSSLSPEMRIVQERRAARVAQAGESIQSYFDEDELRTRLTDCGFRDINDMGPRQIASLYFPNRIEAMPGKGGHIVRLDDRAVAYSIQFNVFKTFYLFLALLLPGISLSLSAQESGGSATIRCGSLLDPDTNTVVRNATITIEDGLVKQIATDTTAPATSINLTNGFCLPGLIDVHDHLTSDPQYAGYRSLGLSVPREAIIGAKNARRTLLAGFTTIRNVGASGFSDVALRDGINDGEIPGPRAFVSGPPLGITGGHCDNDLLAPEYDKRDFGVADGPWAARAKVREVIKYGADLIKICASGGVLSKGDAPGAEQYTPEEMRAIAEEAHKLGRKVAAHAHGTQAIKDAIIAGIDSIEHASLIDEEGIALAKQHGTYLVFDIYNDTYILNEGPKIGMLPESIEKEKAIGKLQRANFRKAYLAGAPLAFGTDGGVYPHGDNAKQLAVMVEFGMKPAEAIRTATTNAAKLMSLDGKAGTVKVGSYADIIAVADDPRTHVEQLENVKFVMKNGRVYKNDWQPAMAIPNR